MIYTYLTINENKHRLISYIIIEDESLIVTDWRNMIDKKIES